MVDCCAPSSRKAVGNPFGGGGGDDEPEGFMAKTMSFMPGAKKPAAGGGAGGLPPNWKKAKDKEGKVYYFNTLTKAEQYTMPKALPKGWTEALHKESGRVMYQHKATKKTTFNFPEDDDGDDGAEEEAEEEEGMLGKTMSFFGGNPKKKNDDGGLIGKTLSFMPGSKKAPAAAAAAPAKKPAAASPDGKKKMTVNISASMLIKEVKLCIDEKKHPPLDKLLEGLEKKTIDAPAAVKNLTALVGTTTVQQAGLSLKNAKTGALPHGWLEFPDTKSGRNYYYNIHTKKTTWYKPKKDDVSEGAKKLDESKKADEGEAVAIDISADTVMLTGEL